jgi:hypothetical protein
MNIDLTDRLLERNKPRAGEVGRYHISKIAWWLYAGFPKPEDYLKGEQFDFPAILRMWRGEKKHEMIQELLPEYKHEIKKEWVWEGFVVVGKVDCINIWEILELKTSEKLYDKAKPWAVNQLKIYLTMFERPTGRILQPVISNNKLILNELAVVKRDDNFFAETMKKVKEFDKEVKKLSLEECIKGCDNFDDFCEKCGKQINKSNMTARDVWDEHIAK